MSRICVGVTLLGFRLVLPTHSGPDRSSTSAGTAKRTFPCTLS